MTPSIQAETDTHNQCVRSLRGKAELSLPVGSITTTTVCLITSEGRLFVHFMNKLITWETSVIVCHSGTPEANERHYFSNFAAKTVYKLRHFMMNVAFCICCSA